jgi:uncharacterized repeat protein (TIGR03803 family)
MHTDLRRFEMKRNYKLMVVMIVALTTAAPGGITKSILHNFPSRSVNPFGQIARDAAGNIYGAAGGGRFAAGVIFKLDSAGNLSLLHTFMGGPDSFTGGSDGDGGYPYGGVIVDGAGNIYGTTAYGGSYGYGIVFKIDATGHYSILHSFAGGADGETPFQGVTPAADGSIYGTTNYGGINKRGVIYKIDASGNYTVLSNNPVGYPDGPVILDGAGNIYGTGGSSVFKLDPSGNVVYSYLFSSPFVSYFGLNGGLALDSAGNVYGTTAYGGAPIGAYRNNGDGIAFKVSPSGQETDIYYFASQKNPSAGVLLDAAGNMYGTTAAGGGYGHGVVFKIDTAGNETVLYEFLSGVPPVKSPPPFQLPGMLVLSPSGPPNVNSVLIRDASGNFYGTFTVSPLPKPGGIIYKLDTSNQYSVLHQFVYSPDGYDARPKVALDSSGNIYGTTAGGGPQDAGTVYKIDATGVETVAYRFRGGTDGSYPFSGVIVDSAANVYGTVLETEPHGNGQLYKVSPAGKKTVVSEAGILPYGDLVRDASGNFYFTSYEGWTNNCGAVFKLDTAGKRTFLHQFTGSFNRGDDGCGPFAGVTLDAAGNVYGTTIGGSGGTANSVTVYKIDASGNYSKLYVFTPEWATPSVVVVDAAGNLYGTTANGGTYNSGVVYKMDSTGHEMTLYNFTGAADGAGPATTLVMDSSGNFYGTTSVGGDLSGCSGRGCGVVFKLDAAGNETVLYTFTGGADGAIPGSIILDSSGNLYGTTTLGGTQGGGTVFKLTGAVQ